MHHLQILQIPRSSFFSTKLILVPQPRPSLKSVQSLPQKSLLVVQPMEQAVIRNNYTSRQQQHHRVAAARVGSCFLVTLSKLTLIPILNTCTRIRWINSKWPLRPPPLCKLIHRSLSQVLARKKKSSAWWQNRQNLTRSASSTCSKCLRETLFTFRPRNRFFRSKLMICKY